MDTKELNFREEIKRLQKDLSLLNKPCEAITKLKPGDSEILAKLEKARQALPPGELHGKRMDEINHQLQQIIGKANAELSQQFKLLESQYIREIRSNGQNHRETASGWRIGRFEMHTSADKAQVRFAYNEEVVVNWQTVSSVEEIKELEKQAGALLDKWALPAEEMPDLFMEAFRSVGFMQEGTHKELVNIGDFYRELRLVLIRHSDLRSKPQTKVSKFVEFPRFAFIYNLDLYRQLAGSLPEGKKLGFQTGSMKEVNAGKGFVVNGLEPDKDYKMMCYMIMS